MADKQSPPVNPPTNYRKNRQRSERNLLFLVMFVLVGIGAGLILLIWGPGAALTGILCLGGGAVLIGGLYFLLTLLQKAVGDD